MLCAVNLIRTGRFACVVRGEVITPWGEVESALNHSHSAVPPVELCWSGHQKDRPSGRRDEVFGFRLEPDRRLRRLPARFIGRRSLAGWLRSAFEAFGNRENRKSWSPVLRAKARSCC